ncbi:hypothetical protein Pelo_4998 [Pelomyxa schiedti]|nr:hypothetical protein Pelo_4998 [Pelomyxa schiedti]
MGTHGEALVRILVDFVALVLTEQRLCFDVWGLLPCREKWMARFCLTVSPLFGITSDVIELEYSSDPTKPLSEEDWWQAENTLWEVVCYPKVCCRCDPLKNMRLISKAGGREDVLVPFDGVMGHVVVWFVGLDRVTPNELLLIVSQEGKLATVIHMVIDLESSFTSKSLVVLDKAAFKWPFRMDPRKAQCEVISAFAMRKPTGQRAFLSHINWYQTSKSEVIEFVEKLTEGSGTTRVLASFELQCHISKFSESLFFLFSWNPPAGWSYTLWDCSGSTSAPIQCFQLVECTDDDLELDSKTTGTGVAVYCVPPNGIRVVELLSCVTVLNIELIGAPAPAYRIQFE